MDNGITKEILKQVIDAQSEEGTLNVVAVDFPMFSRPVDVQLTIHINNLLSTYGSKTILAVFKDFLYNPENMNNFSHDARLGQMINYYGVEACQDWFASIYGWDFKKVG